MRFTSPSRRTLGLLAVSAIGMSTAVLGVTGIASAAPSTGTLAAGQTITAADVDTMTVGAGVCAVDWTLTGAKGGAASDGTAGLVGGYLKVTTDVQSGDVFDLHRGVAGSAGTTTTGGGAGAVSSESELAGQDGTNHYASDETTIDGGGGGGGSASGVYRGGFKFLVAFGGQGGGVAGTSGDGAGGYGGLSGSNYITGSTTVSTTTNGQAAVGAAPGVSATGVACVSRAPYLNYVAPGDGSLDVDFTAPDNDNGVVVTGYELTVDGGNTWAALTTPTLDGRIDATVSGLVNEQQYDVGVRAVSGTGGAVKGKPSPFLTVTPYKPLPAPVITSLTSTNSQVTLTWTAPAGDVQGYDVGWFQGERGDGGCATAPTVLSCTFAVPAGTDYIISVRAIDAQQRAGTSAYRENVTVVGPAVPAALPTKDDGDLVGPAGPISTLTAGQKITLLGDGYAPNSTVQLTVFSSPVSLGTVVTDQDGKFSVEVTVPANLANGTHHLVATGVDKDGNVRNLVIAVTVNGGVATLATTGFDAVPVAAGGALVLLVGGGLLVGARRRTDA